MRRKLILHDLSEEEAALYLPEESDNTTLFTSQLSTHNCIGCFDCWVKTPGICVIKDEVGSFCKMIPDNDVLIVVSKCVYGGLSPEVKVVLDRSIGICLPFFRVVNKETHHYPRYKNMPELVYHFYGLDITEREKGIARKLTAANALNLYAAKYETFFHASVSKVKEALS